jgi:hypothetical protein
MHSPNVTVQCYCPTMNLIKICISSCSIVHQEPQPHPRFLEASYFNSVTTKFFEAVAFVNQPTTSYPSNKHLHASFLSHFPPLEVIFSHQTVYSCCFSSAAMRIKVIYNLHKSHLQLPTEKHETASAFQQRFC